MDTQDIINRTRERTVVNLPHEDVSNNSSSNFLDFERGSDTSERDVDTTSLDDSNFSNLDTNLNISRNNFNININKFDIYSDTCIGNEHIFQLSDYHILLHYYYNFEPFGLFLLRGVSLILLYIFIYLKTKL